MDWLVDRACELLEPFGSPVGASEAQNCELLATFVAGGVQSVLVCASQRSAAAQQYPPAAHPVPAPAGAPAGAAEHPTNSPEPSAASSQADAQHTEAASIDEGGPSARQQPMQCGANPTPATCSLHVCIPSSMPAELHGCPAVYFTRSGSQRLQPLEMEAAVAYNLLPTGPSLTGLHHLLAHVVSPWLSTHQTGQHGTEDIGAAGLHSSNQIVGADRSAPLSGGSGGGSLTVAAVEQLLAATHKFADQVAAAAKHLRSEVQVQLPQGVDLGDVGAAAASEEAVLACEQCMEGWVQLITNMLQREGGLGPTGRGPLPELDFWQQRAEAYGGLLEQLSVPAMHAVQSVVERASMDRNLLASFRAQLSELTRMALEARDNVKFLLTLERHFRAMHAGSLPAVADALHPMLNALRMIWVISRYYGDDVHMSNLLGRIAQGLQDRLDAALDIRALFQAPAAQSLALVRTCQAIAEGWQGHYMAMREKIEDSGHHARWEFSRQLLFERTNYVAEVCGELLSMLEALDDFRQFLGPELKAVTGDTSMIDEVTIMVQAMVEPVESVEFTTFDKAHAADWRAVRSRFARDADDIKLATRDLIDTCFRKLRSVDAAAQLLHSFQRIQAQGAMQQQMADKLAAVLEHFIKEIHAVRRLFEEGREDPPLTRNMPPLAGSVRWSRSLLGRLRRTWVRLQALNSELEALDAGRRASTAMTDLAKAMLSYEKARFASWSATVDGAVTSGLQQPLLRRQAGDGEDSGGGVPAADSKPSGCGGGSGGSRGCIGHVAINFPPVLLRLMREAKYLDQLGFAVPQLAVNLALQEGQIRDHIQDLSAMLERHRAAGASLHSAERALLGEQLAALEAVLEPGLSRINWNSLTIPDFVAVVNKAVDQFAALVAQVQKNTSVIEKTIYHITKARLVPHDAPAPAGALVAGAATAAGASSGSGGRSVVQQQERASSRTAVPPAAAAAATTTEHAAAAGAAQAEGDVAPLGPSPEVPDLQEFYEDFEQHRQQVVEGLVGRYRSVGPLLVKVEELLAGSATGKAPRLAGYYAYWERRLFNAVKSMVVSGLQAFRDRMHACRLAGATSPGAAQEEDAEAGSSHPSKPPLFRVALSLIQPEVMVTPSTAEAARQLGRMLRNLVESAKPFVRWMDGTCLQAPEQYVYGDDAEPFVFCFFADVSQSPSVIKAMLAAQHEVQRATAGVGRLAERWRSYGLLWKADRAAALAKLRSRRLNMAAAEEKLAQYHRLGEDAWAAGVDHDIYFIRVRCAPLAAAVRAEAQAWVRGIAEVLADFDKPEQAALRQQAAALLAAVQLQPAEEDDVDKIHTAIAAVVAAAPDAWAACSELEERCRGRLQFAAAADAPAGQAELAGIQEVAAAWQQLQAAAVEREQQGVQLPALPGGGGGGAGAGEGGGDSWRQPEGRVSAASVRRGSIARAASSSSSLSSAAPSRTKQSRGPSRALPSRQQQQ